MLVGFAQSRGFQIQAAPQSRARMASPGRASDPVALLGPTSLSGSLSHFFSGVSATSQAPLRAAAESRPLTVDFMSTGGPLPLSWIPSGGMLEGMWVSLGIEAVGASVSSATWSVYACVVSSSVPNRRCVLSLGGGVVVRGQIHTQEKMNRKHEE